MRYVQQVGANVWVINVVEPLETCAPMTDSPTLFQIVDGEVPVGFEKLNYTPSGS